MGLALNHKISHYKIEHLTFTKEIFLSKGEL